MRKKQFVVHVDSKGYVLIPSEVRKAMKIESKTAMLLSQEGGEIHMIPGEFHRRHEPLAD